MLPGLSQNYSQYNKLNFGSNVKSIVNEAVDIVIEQKNKGYTLKGEINPANNLIKAFQEDSQQTLLALVNKFSNFSKKLKHDLHSHLFDMVSLTNEGAKNISPAGEMLRKISRDNSENEVIQACVKEIQSWKLPLAEYRKLSLIENKGNKANIVIDS